jgi:hypothetical protein
MRQIELFVERYGQATAAGIAVAFLIVTPLIYRWLCRERSVKQAKIEWIISAIIYAAVGFLIQGFVFLAFPIFLWAVATAFFAKSLFNPTK